MSVPGSNWLNVALSAITSQAFQYFPAAARLLNAVGQYQGVYSAPLSLLGSVQPVPRNLYEREGLSFDKYYVRFFVSQNAVDVSRDSSGDLITFQNNTYQVLSITAWHGIDGWVEILSAQVQNWPLITALTAPAAGNYVTGAPLTFTVTFNQNVNVTGAPYIALAAQAGVVGGNAVYTGGSGTPTLTFTYTVQDTDTASGLVAAAPVAGAIANAAGVAANASFVAPDLSGVTLNA